VAVAVEADRAAGELRGYRVGAHVVLEDLQARHVRVLRAQLRELEGLDPFDAPAETGLLDEPRGDLELERRARALHPAAEDPRVTARLAQRATPRSGAACGSGRRRPGDA